MYTFSTLTPLQRPTALTGKVALTEAELAEQEERDAENRVNEDRPLRPGDTGTYNNFWTSNEKGRRTGKVALLVDPEDTEALFEALRRVTSDQELREDLARRGIDRAKMFTWEKAVRETWEVYRKIM